jgi:hypothetical protein
MESWKLKLNCLGTRYQEGNVQWQTAKGEVLKILGGKSVEIFRRP